MSIEAWANSSATAASVVEVDAFLQRQPGYRAIHRTSIEKGQAEAALRLHERYLTCLSRWARRWR